MINIFALPTLETSSQVLGWSPDLRPTILSSCPATLWQSTEPFYHILPRYTKIISAVPISLAIIIPRVACSILLWNIIFCTHPLYEETTNSSTSPNALWQTNILLENSPYLQMMFPAVSCFFNLQSPWQTTPRRVAWDHSLTFLPWKTHGFPFGQWVCFYQRVAIHMEVS